MDEQPRLETERLVLERFTPELARAIDGPRQADWADGFPALGERRAALWVTESGNNPANFPFLTYTVRERASGLLIGGAGFHNVPKDRVIEIGYGFSEAAWGNGYATEAALALIDAAKSSGHVDALVARTDESNSSSQAVLERCDFAPTTPARTNWRLSWN
jgi:RimJ/RimL family protein N-acetyltransferase